MKNVFYLIVLFLLIPIGCSSKSAVPVNPNIESTPLLFQNVDEPNGRNLLGIWSVQVDPDSLECVVIADRSLLTHYNITGLIPAPVVRINSINPNGVIDIDVKLTNPFSIDAYDIRLIIFTNDSSDSFLDPDDWTPLYDIPGGMDINPFRAYSKSEPLRKFARNSEQTESLDIYLEPGHTYLHFAVDASYPSNCEEPYSIDNFTQETLGQNVGNSAIVEVDVLDWQNNVSEVLLECPEITGQPSVSFISISLTRWQIDLVNETGAPFGEYTGYVTAKSSDSGTLALYDRVIITVAYIPASGSGGVLTWSGQQKNAYGDNVECDSSGNIYCLCRLNLYKPILMKLNPDFHVIWTTPVCGPSSGSLGAHDLAISDSGFVYIIGNFNESIDFDPGPGEDIRASRHCGRYETYYTSDIFISKFDTDGNYYWTKDFGNYCYMGSGEGNDSGNAICLDDAGDLYVTGSMGDWDSWDTRLLIAKTSQVQGSSLWMCSIASDAHSMGNYGYGIVHDGNGKVSVTGRFYGTMDFDPGPGEDIHEATGGDDIFLTQFDSNGGFQWAQTWGSPAGYSCGNGLAVDNDGNIFVSGDFWSNIDLDPGPPSEMFYGSGFFLSKFTSSGDYLWGKAWDGHNNYWGFPCLASFCSDNIYVMCIYRGTDIDFDPGPGFDLHSTSDNDNDLFISKFDTSGNFIWARTWYGPDAEEIPRSIACDPQCNIFTTGYFIGSLDFDPGPDVFEKTTDEKDDAFLLKLLPNGYWE